MAYSKLNTKDMAYIALSAAFMSVCAWISVPATVPFTLQTFAVFLCAAVFGSRRAAIAIIVYIILGAAGLPVFSGFRGGPGMLVGATGGFISGFLPAAVIAGWHIRARKSAMVDIIFMLTALFVCYVFGTLWYAVIYGSGLAAFKSALLVCVVPYVVPDCIKIALAAALAPRLRRYIKV